MNVRLLRIVTLAVLLGLSVTCLQARAAEEGKKEGGLPADAKGFAGMIAGKVTASDKNTVTVEVTKIDKIWKRSNAKHPKSLVGQNVVVVPPTEGKHAESIARFFKSLKVGEEVVLDVVNKKGNTLKQRRRAGTAWRSGGSLPPRP
jgi:hypothetical protein